MTTPESDPGVRVTLRDVWTEVRSLGALVEQVKDHERRIRATERWLYALPPSLLMAAAAVGRRGLAPLRPGIPVWATGVALFLWIGAAVFYPLLSSRAYPWHTHLVTAGELAEYARELAGDSGRSAVVVAEDPAEAIVAAAEREQADVIVVGSVGMTGRKEFLLRNVPNRVSHNASCTVVIVQTNRANS